MTIPSYPLFTVLGKEHKPLFDGAFEKNPPAISELTFTNLYSWRHAYGFEVSMFDPFIILRSKKGFFTPLGSGGIKPVMKRMLKESGGVLIRVPEAAKISFNNDPEVIVELDRDNSDYLFRVKDLVELQGRKYDGKRGLIKKFKQEYAYSFIRLDPSSIARSLDFEERWCSIKDCDGVEGLNNERAAIKDMVGNFREFNLMGGAIEIKDSILALAIGERLNPDTLVMHVLKADPNIPGLYQAMLNEFLEKNGSDFEYVNLEQDLGIEGLRRSKESYHPVKMIDKYIISLE